jgi:uncharacterized protein YciI
MQIGENILNNKPLQVFVILAETLAGWRNPTTDEGKEVLRQHYAWAAELKAKEKLILAGPTDVELTSTGKLNPIGHTTGLIMLKVESREEAEEWAFKDPFHINGFRRNAVLSMKITITENSLFEPLEQLIIYKI